MCLKPLISNDHSVKQVALMIMPWLKAPTVLSRLSLFIRNNFQHWKTLLLRQETTFIGGTITAFTVVLITKHLWHLESPPNQIHFINLVQKTVAFSISTLKILSLLDKILLPCIISQMTILQEIKYKYSS